MAYDDFDLDALLNEATAGEQIDAEDDKISNSIFGRKQAKAPAPTAKPAQPAPQQPQPVAQAPAAQPETKPVAAPEPVVVAQPTPVEVRPTPAPTNDRISLDLAKRFINVLDTYRSMDDETKFVIAQFATPDKDSAATEAKVVAGALNTNHADYINSMRLLKESKAASAVDRVFFLLKLSDHELTLLEDLVCLFAEKEITSEASLDRVKELVLLLENLDMQFIELSERISKVLTASQEDTE